MTKAVPLRGCGCAGEKCRLPKGDARHGQASSYRNYGCKCQRCRRAWAIYWRAWVHRDPARYEREKKRRRERYLKSKQKAKAVAA